MPATYAAKYVERELTSEGPMRRDSGATARRGRRTVTVNLAESPLTWLYSRGHLDDRQNDGCERLRADYERAQLAPSITMNWNAIGGGGGGGGGGKRGASDLTPGERQLAARARFDGALAAAGPGLADVLWRVVCAGESLPDAEKSLAWPTRSGKLVLRLALDRVAGFYRIA